MQFQCVKGTQIYVASQQDMFKLRHIKQAKEMIAIFQDKGGCLLFPLENNLTNCFSALSKIHK